MNGTASAPLREASWMPGMSFYERGPADLLFRQRFAWPFVPLQCPAHFLSPPVARKAFCRLRPACPLVLGANAVELIAYGCHAVVKARHAM